jgi:hypothetical protein
MSVGAAALKSRGTAVMTSDINRETAISEQVFLRGPPGRRPLGGTDPVAMPCGSTWETVPHVRAGSRSRCGRNIVPRLARTDWTRSHREHDHDLCMIRTPVITTGTTRSTTMNVPAVHDVCGTWHFLIWAGGTWLPFAARAGDRWAGLNRLRPVATIASRRGACGSAINTAVCASVGVGCAGGAASSPGRSGTPARSSGGRRVDRAR